MNIIEQYGSYENAKNAFEASKKAKDFFQADIINHALKEYRRENNIFELDDKFVFLNGDNPEIMTVQFVWDDAVWGGYCGEIPKNSEIRHAKLEELEAGYRL